MTDLPAGWKWTTLGELAADVPRAITDGPFGSNLTSAHYTESGPHVVRLQNIGDGVYINSPAHIAPEHFENLKNHEVKAGDLLVASLGEVLPRACLAPEDLGPAIVKADCIRIRLSDEVDAKWVLYALQRPSVRRWAEEHRHGVGRPRLGLKGIRALPVPLPPLAEQRRIVAILEDHLSRLDAASDYAAAAARRAARLPLAALSIQRPVTEAAVLPLREVLTSGLSNGKSVPTQIDGFPVLRLTALGQHKVHLGHRKGGSWSFADARPFLVELGDYMVSRGNGSLRLVGRGAPVIDEPDPVAYPDTLIRVRTDPERICPAYLHLIWNSVYVRQQIERVARTTAGIYKINQKHLESVLLPLPTLQDQKSVVDSVSQVSDAAERLSGEAMALASKAQRLRRALLAAAFSGRLTGRSSDLDVAEKLAEVGTSA